MEPRARLLAALVVIAACTSGPPAFQFEPDLLSTTRSSSESLFIGSPATPPPGEYRSAHLYADGTGEARELFVPDGPGPWLSYSGRVRVPASAVQEALAAAATPESPADSSPDEQSVPCVLAVESASGTWQGRCAHRPVAARLLTLVPRLAMPDATCDTKVCQIRIARQREPLRHERYGEVRQDRVLDRSGVVWCATRDDRATGRIARLRVERGRISQAHAIGVFTWVLGTAESAGASSQSEAADADSVMVRARGADWVPLTASAASSVRARWNQVAARFPEACR